MKKRRRGPKGPDTREKELRFKNSLLQRDKDINEEEDEENFMYDEIDKFHLQKDKLLLDPGDEESSEEEEEEEEVLGLAEQDDEYDEYEKEDEDLEEDADENEILGKVEEKMPSDKAWGKKKKVFYDADVKDDDIFDSDEDAERAALEEEEEALTLQKRMTEHLDQSDFDLVPEVQSEDEKMKEDEKEKDERVVKDLSSMSKEEKLEILMNESPELPLLVDEYQEKIQEIKDIYHPLFLLTKRNGFLTKEGTNYVQTKYRLLLNYCVHISFYLYLKSKQQDIRDHPIMERLVEHQKLLKELEPVDRRLQPEIKEVLEKGEWKNIELNSKEVPMEIDRKGAYNSTVTKEKFTTKNIATKHTNSAALSMDPLQYYNAIKEATEQEKIRRKNKNKPLPMEESDELSDEESKRGITYEMAKNKGLTRKRKKEQRNPRVKHKTKYKKAMIKRRSQVRAVVKELDRYGGEMTGIKANLTRSVKIK